MPNNNDFGWPNRLYPASARAVQTQKAAQRKQEVGRILPLDDGHS